MDAGMTQVALAALMGLGLAASCGLRVFLPMLVAGLAVRAGELSVVPEMAWIASTPALITLGVASVAEIGAAHVPWVDHVLDLIALPAAMVAGTLLGGAMVIDVSPWLHWTLAAIAGGGSAGVVHAGAAAIRATSTAMTGGLANPLVAFLETLGSLIAAVLAVLAPVLALAVLAGATLAALRWRQRRAPVLAPT